MCSYFFSTSQFASNKELDMYTCEVPLCGSIRSFNISGFFEDVDLMFYYRQLYPMDWDPTNAESKYSWWFELGPDDVHKDNPNPELSNGKRYLEEDYYLTIYDHLKKHNKTSKVQFFVVTIPHLNFGRFLEKLKQYTQQDETVEPLFILPWTRVCFNPSKSSYNRSGTIPHLHRHMLIIARDGDDFKQKCFNDKIIKSNEIETLESYWKRNDRSRKLKRLFDRLPETCDAEDDLCPRSRRGHSSSSFTQSWKGAIAEILSAYLIAKCIVRVVEYAF